MAYFFGAVFAGLSALAALLGGSFLIQPADSVGRRRLGRPVLALWVLAGVAAVACIVFLLLLAHYVAPGGGAED